MTNTSAGHKLESLLAVLVAALPVLKAAEGLTFSRDDGGASMTAAGNATDAMFEGFGREEFLSRAAQHIAEHGTTNQTFIGLVELVIQEWTDQIGRESAKSDLPPARQQATVRQSHRFA